MAELRAPPTSGRGRFYRLGATRSLGSNRGQQAHRERPDCPFAHRETDAVAPGVSCAGVALPWTLRLARGQSPEGGALSAGWDEVSELLGPGSGLMGMKALASTLAAASLLLAGCGSTTAANHPSPSMHLTIAVAPGFIANQHTKRYMLSCSPTAGTVPDPAKACKALLASPKLLAPLTCHLAPDVGGELIGGQFNGRHIQLRLSGSAPCTSRWRTLAAALGIPPLA